MFTLYLHYSDDMGDLKTVHMKFSEEMLEAIDLVIEIGQAVNRSDFIRRAVAEKLAELTVTTEMKKRKLK